MAIKQENYLKKEQIEAAIKQGLNTYEALGAALGRSAKSMKKIMDGFGMTLKEPEPIKMNNFSVSDESEWDQLYKDYDLEGAIGNQARFIIAQCRVIDGMTAAQTRQYMEDNFHYQIIDVNPKSIHENRMKKMISKYHLV